MKNAALAIMKAAQEAGYTFRVTCDGDTDYEGPSATKAWEACKAVEECHVFVSAPAGTDPINDFRHVGTMLVIAGLDPSENVSDYTHPASNDWLDQQWKKVFRENEAAA